MSTLTTTSGSDVEQIVVKNNAGWYNYLAQAMNLDPKTFMLAQGTLGLQTADSSGLFLMGDAVPPSASVAYFDSGGISKRSSAYGGLLFALLPETGGANLQTALGDMYTNWLDYRKSYFAKNPDSDKTQKQLFTQWANQNLDPNQVGPAMTAYDEQDNTPLNGALNAYNDPAAKQKFSASDGTSYSLYRYSCTNTAATAAINGGGGPLGIDFDTESMNSTLTQTTAEGSATGFYDIFSGGVSGSFDQLNTKAASSAFSITGTVNKYATLPVNAGSWFASGEFSRAYNAKNDNTVWAPSSSPNQWDSFFGQPDGSLARRVSQLVLVSGYDLTITSHASYNQSDLQTIKTKASFGVWPFFSASASATHTSSYELDSSGNLVVTLHLNPGLIQIWGVTVQAAPQ
ncbi:hypothetical protein [Tautonia plasticadhaerens]|uniref:Uncharacterized protein n=1 Tax=Tautonia plasticadhaerens TaxID=2527974 RepID=A0A518HDQ0_9BACT|nr:hypothetical protein [Tautonia plasticadhaerens]QDV38984.1 hypothetical protein ElP_69450 [Tautonia plasticadhaerens]